jgi:hypothetical protein
LDQLIFRPPLDHQALTFQHNGRDERLIITSGTVIKDIIA